MTRPDPPFKIPRLWGLSDQQECVIGSLLDAAGSFVSPFALADALYDDPTPTPNMVAPAKLRVLVQRCREILADRSDGKVTITNKRNTGWTITLKHRAIMQRVVDKAEAL